MCDSWHDYVKPKYGKMVKLSNMETDKLTVYVNQNTSMQIFLEMIRKDLTH